MAERRPLRPLTREQSYLDAILGELRGINAKLDGQAIPEPARPASVEPERVRLEEPVRPGEVETKLQPGERVLPRDEVIERGIDVENDVQMSPIDQHSTCQEITKRGNTCGKPLPCRYHG